jgi:HAD superfamily hydrolase (TIGR01509 family)
MNKESDMSIKFVIFDMDGTLVDSELCASQALCDVWPELPMSAEEMNDEYRGMKFGAKLEVLSTRYGIEIPEGTETRLREREAVLGETMITINPGVTTVLDTLAEREINFCIASNAPKAKSLRNANGCGIGTYFENRAVYSAHDLQAWKPDPTMFLHAAENEGVKPEQCLVVEDSETGIGAGLAAGMRVFFYDAHSTGTAQSPVESGSDFRDVLNHLGANT